MSVIGEPQLPRISAPTAVNPRLSLTQSYIYSQGFTEILTHCKLVEMLVPNIATSRSLPNPTPCLSYWQRTTRAYPHLYANIDATVPSNSKYVIVGSGISGGLTAFKLIEGGAKAEDIVILEAREAASGASSRNAGHVRPGLSGFLWGYCGHF